MQWRSMTVIIKWCAMKVQFYRVSQNIWCRLKFIRMTQIIVSPKLVNYDSNKKWNNLISPHKEFSEKNVPSLSTNCFIFLWLNFILFKMRGTKSWHLLFSNHIFNDDLWINEIRIVYLSIDCCVFKSNSQFFKNIWMFVKFDFFFQLKFSSYTVIKMPLIWC